MKVSRNILLVLLGSTFGGAATLSAAAGDDRDEAAYRKKAEERRNRAAEALLRAQKNMDDADREMQDMRWERTYSTGAATADCSPRAASATPSSGRSSRAQKFLAFFKRTPTTPRTDSGRDTDLSRSGAVSFFVDSEAPPRLIVPVCSAWQPSPRPSPLAGAANDPLYEDLDKHGVHHRPDDEHQDGLLYETLPGEVLVPANETEELVAPDDGVDTVVASRLRALNLDAQFKDIVLRWVKYGRNELMVRNVFGLVVELRTVFGRERSPELDLPKMRDSQGEINPLLIVAHGVFDTDEQIEDFIQFLRDFLKGITDFERVRAMNDRVCALVKKLEACWDLIPSHQRGAYVAVKLQCFYKGLTTFSEFLNHILYQQDPCTHI